jgi:hypothetical protein
MPPASHRGKRADRRFALWRPPGEDYLDEEAAAAEWARQNRDRWDPNFFIGPQKPISIRTARRVRAPPPRERGLNRMERGFKHAISSMIVRGLTTNLTPRKCLGFKTPFQALLAELGKDVQIRFS